MDSTKIIDILLWIGGGLVGIILALIGVSWTRHEKDEERRSKERKEDVTELFKQTRELAERITKLETQMATKEDIFGLYNEIRKHVDVSHDAISENVENCSRAIALRIDGLVTKMKGDHQE